MSRARSRCSSAGRSQHGQGNEKLPDDLPPSVCTKSIRMVGEEQKRGLGSLCAALRRRAGLFGCRAGLFGVQDPCKPCSDPGVISLTGPGSSTRPQRCPSPGGHQYGVAGLPAPCCPCPKPLAFEILLYLVARPAFIPRALGVKVRSVS